MPLPVQVWNARWHCNPFDKNFAYDVHQAQAAWQGETTLWLDPEATEVVRWRVALGKGSVKIYLSQCIVPAERPNVITVFHVDEDRCLFPPIVLREPHPHLITHFPQKFYQQWLRATVSLVPGTRDCTGLWPVVEGDMIAWRERCWPIQPGPPMPVLHTDDTKRLILFGLPGVDPEIHSKRRFGRSRFVQPPVDVIGLPVAVAEKEPDRQVLNIGVRWPEPFDTCFQGGMGMSLFFHRARLAQCITWWREGQSQRALDEAKQWIGRFTSVASAPMEQAWFLPKFFTHLRNITALTTEVLAKYQIDTSNITGIFTNESLSSKRQQSIKVQRVSGWLGYVWWEFYQDLKNNASSIWCEDCGSLLDILPGQHRDRWRCRKEENPDCFRNQARKRQQKRRAKGR